MTHRHKPKKSIRRPARLRKARKGFTLIEILVVIGMLAILSTIVLVAVNPLRQFAQARESQRQNDVSVILNAVSERIADNGGAFIGANTIDGCTATGIPAVVTEMDKKDFDIRSCLVSTYVSNLPHDPTTGNDSCTTSGCTGTYETYDTGYTIQEDPATRRVTVCAPAAAEAALPGSAAFCLSR